MVWVASDPGIDPSAGVGDGAGAGAGDGAGAGIGAGAGPGEGTGAGSGAGVGCGSVSLGCGGAWESGGGRPTASPPSGEGRDWSGFLMVSDLSLPKLAPGTWGRLAEQDVAHKNTKQVAMSETSLTLEVVSTRTFNQLPFKMRFSRYRICWSFS